ncbi:RDD family protein [Elizabethkingia ursingii]|uniref:RDD family protein n=1 Tax=Elizabethkingia ursingii TaxID=1756150 RepID=UPI0020132296|nr:RDD family protein [Elizabethkingia ursingii]MCL1668580.1 RDD family protein [Elizabethkingia ursingii]
MKIKKYIIERIIAGFIDYSIVIVITAFYIYNFGKLDNEGGYTITGVLALAPAILWFVYFIISEVTIEATLGHIIVGLKPVDYKTNKPITLRQSIIRHLLDPIDYFFFLGLIGVLVIYNSSSSQRVGDLLAKTKVIKKKEV